MMKTSWEDVSSWYDALVGEKGHYYHQHVIFPKLLSLFKNFEKKSILDLACGQGILSRYLPSSAEYTGIELSTSLVKAAKKFCKNPSKHHFYEGDITKPFPIPKKEYDLVTILLSIQGIRDPETVFCLAKEFLKKDGTLVLVLNHPCFRIPRQSHWGIDEASQIQYRKMNLYLSPLEIPIQTAPSQGKSSETIFAFHHALSDYSKFLYNAGFVIEKLEEWVSDKESIGAHAKRENRARKEFPLFLTVLAKKNF